MPLWEIAEKPISMSGKSQIAQRATMKIAEEHASSAETGTGERSAYAAFPFSIYIFNLITGGRT